MTSAKITGLTCTDCLTYHWQKLPEFWYNSIKISPTFLDSNVSGGAVPPLPRTPMEIHPLGNFSVQLQLH